MKANNIAGTKMYAGTMVDNFYKCLNCGFTGSKMQVQNHCMKVCFNPKNSKLLERLEK